MNQNKLNVLSRDERLLSFLNDRKDTWKDFKPLARQVDILQSTVDKRRAGLKGQQVKSEGATAAKSDAHKAAIDETVRIGRFAVSYALANHDTDLYAQANRSRTYLQELPDDQSIAVMRQMLEAIKPKVDSLNEYGVKMEDVNKALDAIKKIEDLRNAPRSVVDTRVVAGKGLKEEERTARQTLKIMDNNIHFFDKTAPDFVKGYWQAHKIIDEGGRHDQDGGNAPE